MRKDVFILGVMMGISIFLLTNPLQAEEMNAMPAPEAAPAAAAPSEAASAEPAAEAPAPADDVNYSYGTVVSVSGDQLVVLEYDYDKDAEVQVTYQVSAKAEFNNVKALADLKKDDNIEIYYKDADGKKVAEIIALEQPTPETENAEDVEDMAPADADAPASGPSQEETIPAEPANAAPGNQISQ